MVPGRDYAQGNDFKTRNCDASEMAVACDQDISTSVLGGVADETEFGSKRDFGVVGASRYSGIDRVAVRSDSLVKGGRQGFQEAMREDLLDQLVRTTDVGVREVDL